MKVITMKTRPKSSRLNMPIPSIRLFYAARIDHFGAMASSLCMVHCALCALLPLAMGALGLGFLMSHKIELALTLCAMLFALVAGLKGWGLHRSKQVLGLFILGILSLLGSRVLEMGVMHDGHHNAHHDKAHSSAINQSEDHHTASLGSESNEMAHGEGTQDYHDAEAGSDTLHEVGGLVGMSGGFFLFIGHLLNIRRRKIVQSDCCD